MLDMSVGTREIQTLVVVVHPPDPIGRRTILVQQPDDEADMTRPAYDTRLDDDPISPFRPHYSNVTPANADAQRSWPHRDGTFGLPANHVPDGAGETVVTYAAAGRLATGSAHDAASAG